MTRFLTHICEYVIGKYTCIDAFKAKLSSQCFLCFVPIEALISE